MTSKPLDTYRIWASVLSCNLAKMAEFADLAIKNGAFGIHLDVMDQNFVPELTFGPMFCRALRESGITAPIHIHLMAKPVDRLIAQSIEAGASGISFHPEASIHVHRDLSLIKSSGCHAGLALNPATPPHVVEEVLHMLDFILLMSVNPGYGGQPFLTSTFQKIEKLSAIVPPSMLWLDGGIQIAEIEKTQTMGIRNWVVGSFLSNHCQNALQAIGRTLSNMPPF